VLITPLSRRRSSCAANPRETQGRNSSKRKHNSTWFKSPWFRCVHGPCLKVKLLEGTVAEFCGRQAPGVAWHKMVSCANRPHKMPSCGTRGILCKSPYKMPSGGTGEDCLKWLPGRGTL